MVPGGLRLGMRALARPEWGQMRHEGTRLRSVNVGPNGGHAGPDKGTYMPGLKVPMHILIVPILRHGKSFRGHRLDLAHTWSERSFFRVRDSPCGEALPA